MKEYMASLILSSIFVFFACLLIGIYLYYFFQIQQVYKVKPRETSSNPVAISSETSTIWSQKTDKQGNKEIIIKVASPRKGRPPKESAPAPLQELPNEADSGPEDPDPEVGTLSVQGSATRRSTAAKAEDAENGKRRGKKKEEEEGYLRGRSYSGQNLAAINISEQKSEESPFATGLPPKGKTFGSSEEFIPGLGGLPTELSEPQKTSEDEENKQLIDNLRNSYRLN